MSRARLVLSACLVSGAGLACNSDDLYAIASTSGVLETTGTPTTGEPDPTTSSSSSSGGDSTTTGDDTGGFISTGDGTTEGPGQSCRDVLMCVGMCALKADLACFQMCTQGLDPDAAMNAINLGICVGQGCLTSGACTPQTLQDPLCLACIGFGILNQNPPGCEAEADACM